jgi:hypothetical protein
MRLLKTIGGAGALVGAALIGGTLSSAAMAAPSASPTSSSATGPILAGGVDQEYLDTFLDTLASELGVDRPDLGPAALAAANAAIDAKVAAGDLDADDAAAVKERLAELENPEALLARGGFLGRGPGGFGQGGFGHGPGRGIARGIAEAVDAAADALGLERGALIEALRDKGTLEEVATDQGVAYDTVKQAVLDVVQARLDDAVADEDLTRERADEVLARVTDWLDDGGEANGGIFLHRAVPRGPTG